jgi:hypothetical protein
MNIIVNGRHLWRLFGALAIMVTLALTQRAYGAAPEKAQVIEGGIQQYQLQAINNFKKSFLEHITQSSDVYINHIKAGLHPRESKRRQLMPLFPLAVGEYLETAYTSQAFFAAALKLAATGVIEISLQEAYALSQVLGNTNADLKDLNKALADLAGCQLNSDEGTTVCEQLKANLEPLLGMDFGATDYIANNILALYNRVAERFHQSPNSNSGLSIIEMGHIWRVYFASGHHITLLEDFVTDAVQRKYNYFKREYFNQLGQCENSHCTYSVKEKFDSQLASTNVSAIIERYFSEHQDSSNDLSIIMYRDLSVCQACSCACKKNKRSLMQVWERQPDPLQPSRANESISDTSFSNLTIISEEKEGADESQCEDESEGRAESECEDESKRKYLSVSDSPIIYHAPPLEASGTALQPREQQFCYSIDNSSQHSQSQSEQEESRSSITEFTVPIGNRSESVIASEPSPQNEGCCSGICSLQ